MSWRSPTARGSLEPIDWGAVLLLSVMAVAVSGLSLLNQRQFVDPEYYTGYGQSFVRMWDLFGPTYYVARFPVMFVNIVSQRVLPGVLGFVVLRFLLLLGCGVPLYVLARQMYGRQVAFASYLFLVANPLLPRILTWDLTIFLSIPAALAGFALWYQSPQQWSPLVLVAGFLFGVALSSHVFTGTAIGVYLVVESVFALRRRGGARWLSARLLTLLVGGIACLALGLVFYIWQVGGVSPGPLWNATLGAISAGREYTEAHYVPFTSYYAINYEIYAPVLTTVLLIAGAGSGSAEDTLSSRITWFSGCYVSMYALAVFGLRMNILEYFWYFGHLTIVVYLAVPVIVGRLTHTYGTVAALSFLAGLLAVAFLVRFSYAATYRVATTAAGSPTAVMVLWAAYALCVAGLLSRRRTVVMCCAGFIGVLLQTPFLSRSHLTMYDVPASAVEAPLFSAIRSYHEILNHYDHRGRRVRTWYPTSNQDLRAISSSNLLYTLQDPWAGEGMPLIGERERMVLDDPQTGYLVMLSENPMVLESGVRSLRSAGIKFAAGEDQRWGYPPLTVYARVLTLDR